MSAPPRKEGNRGARLVGDLLHSAGFRIVSMNLAHSSGFSLSLAPEVTIQLSIRPSLPSFACNLCWMSGTDSPARLGRCQSAPGCSACRDPGRV